MRRTLTLALAGLLLFWWTPPARAQSALPTFPRDDTGEVAPPAIRSDGTAYRSGAGVSQPVSIEGDLVSDPGYGTLWSFATFTGGTLATTTIPLALADNRILAFSAHDVTNTQMRAWLSTDLGRTFAPMTDSGALTPAGFHRPTAAVATDDGTVVLGYSCNITAAPGCSSLALYRANIFDPLALPAALNGIAWATRSLAHRNGMTLALLEASGGGGGQQVCQITFSSAAQTPAVACTAAGSAVGAGSEHQHRFFTTGAGIWFVVGDIAAVPNLYRSLDNGATWTALGNFGLIGNVTAPSWCERPAGPCWTWQAGGTRLLRIDTPGGTAPGGTFSIQSYGGILPAAQSGGVRAPNGRTYTTTGTALTEWTATARGLLATPLATLPATATAIGAASPSVLLLGRGNHATDRLMVSRSAIAGGVLGSTGSPAAAACKTTAVNALGVAGADVTIDGTAGGIAVLAANAARCGALLRNAGAAEMRCAPTGLAPTATVGFVVPPGMTLVLGAEGQQAWRCIRTTATSTAAATAEERP